MIYAFRALRPAALPAVLLATGCSTFGGQVPADLTIRPQNAGKPWSYSHRGGVDRYEVRAGDHWSGDGAAPKERSEGYAPRKLTMGATWDVRFRFMVEPGPRNTAAWMTLTQFQSTFLPGEKGHSPPFAIEVKGERMRVASRTSRAFPATNDDFTYTAHWIDPADLVRGHWYAMRVRVRFDPVAGALDVWRDRKRIVAYRGPMGFREPIGAYVKEGVYRGSAPEPFAVRFRRLSIDRVADPR